MIELLMVLSLSPLSTNPVLTAGIQPCVWPNTCKTSEIVQVAQFQPCVWPNKCSGGKKVESVLVASDFEICQWPRKCSSEAGV